MSRSFALSKILKVLLLLVLSFAVSTVFAQSNRVGFVFSHSEETPISYVNISAAHKNEGVSADANGRFVIPEHLANDTLIFSAIGFKTLKVLAINLADTIWLETEFTLLKEVVVKPAEQIQFEPYPLKKEKRIIGYMSNSIPWRLANYYPYSSFNESSPYLYAVNILTESPIKNALFKMSILKADEHGKPTNQPLVQSVLVHVNKGKSSTTVELEQSIEVPKNGFFVIVETLNIKENEYIFEYTDESKQKHSKTYYAPEFIGIAKKNECCDVWRFARGAWYNDNDFEQPQNLINRLGISVVYSN
jgi:hypothetical protein